VSIFGHVFKEYLLPEVGDVFNSLEHYAQQGTDKTKEAVLFGNKIFILSIILVAQGRRWRQIATISLAD